MACSSSPDGSPIPCTDANHFTPYITGPDSSIHDMPSSTMALTSATSLPYSADNVIYTNVPISTSGYYSSIMPTPWMNGNALPEFDAFTQRDHVQIPHNPHHMLAEGEVFVDVIDRTGEMVQDPEIMQQLKFYPNGSPGSSPSSRNHQNGVFFHDMTTMRLPDPCPSYPSKSAKGKCQPH